MLLRLLIALLLTLLCLDNAAANAPTGHPPAPRTKSPHCKNRSTRWDDSYHRQGRSLIADELYDQSRARLTQVARNAFSLAARHRIPCAPLAARLPTPCPTPAWKNSATLAPSKPGCVIARTSGSSPRSMAWR